MGCIPTWDCDVFSLRGHNVSDLDITGSRKVGAPTFYMDWVLYKVLKKMDLVFILASSILEAGKWARPLFIWIGYYIWY